MRGVKRGSEDEWIRFDIKTVSEANQREHWTKRFRRKDKQQRDFTLLWRSHKCRIEPPATITFTRYSCRMLDTDNLAGAFKHVQDALAKELGIDDGDARITWLYRQERIKKTGALFYGRMEYLKMDDPKCKNCGHSVFLHPEMEFGECDGFCSGSEECECERFEGC